MCTTTFPFTPEELAELERNMRERDAHLARIKPTVIPPCPTWCSLPAGHDYESVDEGEGFCRNHSTETGAQFAFVTQLETNTAGVLTFEDASVFVDEGNLDAAQAGAFVVELVAAADLLDRLTA